MYIKTTFELGRTKKKYKIYHLSCDKCRREFTRDTHHFTQKRASNDFKHFCSDCGYRSIGQYGGKLNWKDRGIGIKHTDSHGYIQVKIEKGHSKTPHSHRGYIREHIKVMQDFLGRKLIKGEVVHHIDGNKSNNSLENLDLCTVSEHNNAHAKSEHIVFELYKQGKVGYDKTTKRYFLK